MFGIQQHHEALASAHLQMQQKDFEKDLASITALTVKDIQKASAEEKANIPISNLAVWHLFKHLRTTNGRISATDENQASIQNKIWSTTIQYGLPSLWITINPSNLHDPIAQCFAGKEIDMDNFNPLLGPSAAKQAQNIMKDPYAASKFFFFMVCLILKMLIGITSSGQRVIIQDGIFGRAAAYIGVVESQNRGSLHLHMLLWLEDMPPADDITKLLKTETFRNRIKDFISKNIWAHVPGMTIDSLKAIKQETNLAYCQPPNPDDDQFEVMFKDHLT